MKWTALLEENNTHRFGFPSTQLYESKQNIIYVSIDCHSRMLWETLQTAPFVCDVLLTDLRGIQAHRNNISRTPKIARSSNQYESVESVAVPRIEYY